MDDLGFLLITLLSAATHSQHTLHTHRIKYATPSERLSNADSRSRFRSVDKTALQPWLPFFMEVLPLHVETSCNHLQSVTSSHFSAVILNFFKSIWHWLERVYSVHLQLAYLQSTGSRESVWGGVSLAYGWHGLSIKAGAAWQEWRCFSCWLPTEKIHIDTHTLTVCGCTEANIQQQQESCVKKTHMTHLTSIFPEKPSGLAAML